MKVTSCIHGIKIPFKIPVAPGKNIDRFVYSYVVTRDKTCLIDSGVSGSDAKILHFIEQLGRKVMDLQLLLLTHAHPDHIGAARAIQNKSKCLVAAHSAAKNWVEDIEQQFQDRPVPGFHTLVGGSVKIDRLLENKDTIDLGDTQLRVIHTPGHSRCSISLFCKEDGVLFTGDAIPQGNDLPIYDDVATAVESIRKLKSIVGVKTLLASWSDPVLDADPYQLMNNGLDYFQKIHTVIRQLQNGKSPIDPMDLCKQMVAKLGLPEVAVNPLVARSLHSHIPFIGQELL
jgi:hydroxyacylglutathione hydrolase